MNGKGSRFLPIICTGALGRGRFRVSDGVFVEEGRKRNLPQRSQRGAEGREK